MDDSWSNQPSSSSSWWKSRRSSWSIGGPSRRSNSSAGRRQVSRRTPDCTRSSTMRDSAGLTTAIEAFRLALRLGATGIESDVWLTADGVAVLDHDGVVRSGVRRRRIATVARAALPAHIPTLEELYASCGAAFELSLDVLDPA